MTTLAELVELPPAPTAGQAIQLDGWRHVLELANPAAGSSVEWFDITAFWCGSEYTRGADSYQGRYRASVANLELCTDDDALAPWNDDTSPTFGVHVELGPGLLIRSGLIRVEAGVTVEWNPRFTLKVESWGDAAYSVGRIRRHRIVARDLLSSLATLPLPASDEENWSDRVFRWLTDTDWPYGSLIYGAQFTDPGGVPILLLPARPEQTSALNELDATLDPAGLIWYTDRYGHLVVRPRTDDTFHADAFTAGATGNPWPGSVTPVDFTWYACSDPSTGAASYAVDSGIDPFGLDKTERWVINHVRITTPGTPFDDDDPISIQRYDRKTMQASWIAENDVVAAQILDSRANATVEARPLQTALGMPGFTNGPSTIDYLGYVAIQHRNNDAGMVAYANGWLRQYREQMMPRGCELDWSITNLVDVYATSSDAGLLPVEDLTVVDVTETSAEFSWTNPAQAITPTNTQIRIVTGVSLWATTGYPITGATWSGLVGGTTYTFQVRLIRIVDGLITHVSPTREISFTTDPVTVPTPGDGGVTFPDPGPCDEIDWQLQESDDADGPWSTVDSGTITEAPWEVDLSGFLFNPAKLYRIRSDACGEITFSTLFVGDCSEPAILGDPPFDDPDLEAYWPAICPPDIVVEAITEQYATRGPSWDGFTFDGDGSAVLLADGDGIIVHGLTPTAVQVVTTDSTIACKVLLMTQPDAPVVLFQCAGMKIIALAEDDQWKVRGQATEEVGGVTTITMSGELDFGAWYDIALVHDVAAGDLILYVDGNEEASALGTVGYRHNPDYFEIGCSDNGLITNCAMWSRVLDASELPGFAVPPPAVTINQKAGQSDPAFAGPLLFEAVFSKEVTGFAGSDVALSGTAGATVASLSTLDNITFTVAVSGMTGPGTVIATIPAAVCNAVDGSGPNDASTSTDNTITYLLSLKNTMLAYSPKGMWMLDDPSGTNANDASPNNKDGTYAGSPSLASRTAPNGVQLCDFDASNDQVTVPDDNEWSVTSFGRTLVAVIYADSIATNSRTIMAKYGGSSSNCEWRLEILTTGAVSFRVTQQNGTSIRDARSPASAISAGTWYVIAASSNIAASTSSNFRININGVAQTITYITGSGGSTNTSVQLSIGANLQAAAPLRFDGAIGYCAIFDNLADADIDAIMAAADAEGFF